MNPAGILYFAIFGLGFAAFKAGQYKLFEKAGEAGWKALIPVYNWVIWLKLTGKPVWWVALMLIPIANVLVFVSLLIDLARAYGKHTLGQHAAALLLPFYFFPKIGFDPTVKYEGVPELQKNQPKKSALREWGDAILFAGVAALIIRTFFIEAFMIPTSSMERTMMAGDFLFVSKYHYGTRMPMTPLAVPFVHNKIPLFGLNLPAYTDVVQLPYFRLPGIQKIKRNDIVVFNYPAHDIHDLRDGAGMVKAVTLKENYIKRCVGTPGDSLEVRDGQVFINGVASENPPLMQMSYKVTTDGGGFSQNRLNKLGFRRLNADNANYRSVFGSEYEFFMPSSMAEQFKGFSNVKGVEYLTLPKGQNQSGVYPRYNNSKGQLFSHNIDNYGPILLPKKGMTVELTPKNVSLYQRCITAYEKHEMKEENGKVYIDGQEASTYTFEMDYYWMMGDNRHNSEDSRYWGFVPENHIVGRPLMIFFSFEKEFGIRWDRIGFKYTH